ncbi:PREDICTED: uncharacterized protein LOC109116425 [Tarenaya hassleriana]|uniref:uncharacterized protein LOC109116425 n=1 Tax=Tarenaya hassleriana TaxID=28532 RepID=UPI0008FD7258|nr:PREDICTED: uncharacterized protein LOC109116425 [Tarenaya hassleriana]
MVEGEAMAHAGNLFKVPAIFITAVTDIVDSDKSTMKEYLLRLPLNSSSQSPKMPLRPLTGHEHYPGNDRPLGSYFQHNSISSNRIEYIFPGPPKSRYQP